MEPRVVSDLVDHDTGCWNNELVRAVFEDQSANLILQQPIPSPEEQDRIIWHNDPRGMFSVRSVVGAEQRKRCPPSLQNGGAVVEKTLEAELARPLCCGELQQTPYL